MRPVNLLPPDQRPVTASGKLRGSAYVLVGVLCALLVMTVAYVLSSNSVTEKQDETAKVAAQTQVAKAQAAALQPYGQFGSIKSQRIESVSTLASARFDWERFMRELALVLPKDAWITTVDAATTSQQAATGAAGAAAALAGSGPSAHITGCAKSHVTVATVLVRMEKLSRAEDVKLASDSENGAETTTGSATASPEGCGRYNSFDLTVSFSAVPAPAVAGGKVPVSLGGGE